METAAEMYEIFDEIMALPYIQVTEWTLSIPAAELGSWSPARVTEHPRGRRYEVASGARARRRRR